MIRAVKPIGLFATLSVLVALALIGQRMIGGIDYDLSGVSGQAILAAEQRSKIGDVLAAYPPLPLFATYPLAFLPSTGLPPAVIAALLLAGVLGVIVYYALRSQAVPPAAALAITLLIALNPISVQAFATGPAAVLLMLGMLTLGFGMFGMSGEATAPDVMLTALSLAMLAFAHPFGLILVLASLPGLALAAPSALFARAPVSMLLILLFPVAFCLASFTYSRWALGVEPFTFLDIAIGTARPGEAGDQLGPAALILRFLPALVLMAPLMPAFLYWHKDQPFRFRPALALVSMVVLACALAALLRGHAETVLVLAMSLPVAAVFSVQAAKERLGAIIVLLLAGWVGALLVTTALPARTKSALTPDAELAKVVCPLKGVLVDTRANPDLVQLCGTASGFVGAAESDFEIQIHSRRLTSPYVLVGVPHRTPAFDVLAHTFPDLYRHGADGYVLIYDRSGWRLYARGPEQPMS